MSTPTPLKRAIIKEELFRCPWCGGRAGDPCKPTCFLETLKLIEYNRALLASAFRVPTRLITDNKTDNGLTP